MKWTEIDLKNIVSLLKQGMTYAEISELTGREINAIRVKMGKIGETYEKHNPKIKLKCLECSNDIPHVGKKFCSTSCSAIYNNKLRTSKQIDVTCITCEKIFKTHNKDAKFCSRDCFNLERKRLKDIEIETGQCKSNDTRRYKKYLYEKYGEKCMKCGWCEVNEYTGKIPLELHHVDGNSDNNTLDNFELLCPNHHALTKTWKGAKIENGRFSKRRIKRRENYKEGKST